MDDDDGRQFYAYVWIMCMGVRVSVCGCVGGGGAHTFVGNYRPCTKSLIIHYTGCNLKVWHI
jgi:hypothetical protein